MPDAAGNIKGISLGGKAGETLDRISKKKVGFEACWKLIRSGRNPVHCRRPKGHDGTCWGSSRSCVKG
jgi:hypothetical protein